MLRRIRRLPSPAIVIAMLALVAGVTGAAVAQPVANKAVTTSKAKKIADKEIKKKAPGLSVASAGSLTMYGQIKAAGTLTGNTSGIGAVSHPIAGIYCLSGLAAPPKGGVATVDFNDQSDEFAQFGLGTVNVCPSGTQAFVNTIHNTTDSFADAGFFVTIY